MVENKVSRQLKRQRERNSTGAFTTYTPMGWPKGKTYKPNGERETARRKSQLS